MTGRRQEISPNGVLGPLARCILNSEMHDRDTVHVSAGGDSLVFSREPVPVG